MSTTRRDASGLAITLVLALVSLPDLLQTLGPTAAAAATATPGLSLVALEIEHPEPEPLRQRLDRFGLELPLRPASRPALIATLDSPRGRVILR